MMPNHPWGRTASGAPLNGGVRRQDNGAGPWFLEHCQSEKAARLWSARVGNHYRALAVEIPDGFARFWIGETTGEEADGRAQAIDGGIGVHDEDVLTPLGQADSVMNARFSRRGERREPQSAATGGSTASFCEHFLQSLKHGRDRLRRQPTEPTYKAFGVDGP
jgi:hypothetical protein